MARPGYYWLAYDWDNLLLSCSACNQRRKRNLFPLASPEKRARNHTDHIEREEPLILHPVRDDPEHHIGFRKEIPFAVNGSRAGKATITVLGLDREILNEVRRERLNNLVLLRDVIRQENALSKSAEGRDIVRRARQELADAVSDTAEFAAMARAAETVDFDTHKIMQAATGRSVAEEYNGPSKQIRESSARNAAQVRRDRCDHRSLLQRTSG